MTNILTLIVSLLIFFLVILVHEFGHFFAAKSTGIAVEEFSIGMGPSILSRKKEETLYSLRLIPIGGYVSMENVEETNPNSFNKAPIYKRIIVILAGAFMNFIFALVLFFIISLFYGTPNNTVGEIIQGTPAEESLEVGDEIISINGTLTNTWDDVLSEISNSEKKVELEILRDGNTKFIAIDKNDDNVIGIQPGRELSVINSLKSSVVSIIMIIGALVNFIFNIFTDNFSLDMLSGPVGIVTSINEARSMGLYYLVFFLAYVSVNVGFLNLLPIPPLDGSKFLLLLVEGIRGKSLSVEVEAIINLIGFGIFMLLFIIVTVNDIARFG